MAESKGPGRVDSTKESTTESTAELVVDTTADTTIDSTITIGVESTVDSTITVEPLEFTFTSQTFDHLDYQNLCWYFVSELEKIHKGNKPSRVLPDKVLQMLCLRGVLKKIKKTKKINGKFQKAWQTVLTEGCKEVLGWG